LRFLFSTDLRCVHGAAPDQKECGAENDKYPVKIFPGAVSGGQTVPGGEGKDRACDASNVDAADVIAIVGPDTALIRPIYPSGVASCRIGPWHIMYTEKIIPQISIKAHVVMRCLVQA
jgi:hypothetical protein